MKKKNYIFLFFALFIHILFINSNIYSQNEKDNNKINLSKKKVLVIPIKGPIELGLSSFIKRVFESKIFQEADLLILDVNTPGGRVDAAVEIKNMLLDTHIPTAAYVNKQAISAGALISISCKNIFMKPDSTLGDVQPIPKTEKTVSYVSSQMRSAAEKNLRDVQIAAGMVDADIEIDGIINKGKLITFTTSQAIKNGYCDQKVNDIEDILKYYNINDYEIINIKENWSEKISRILSNPTYSSILFNVGFVMLISEFFTPGFGILGTFGIVLMGLFFLAKFIAGLAGIIEIILIVVGVSLLLAEIFVIPGFGIAGISGIILTILGFLLSFDEMPNVPGMTYKFYLFNLIKETARIAIITFGLSIFGYIIAIRFAYKAGLLNGLILSDETSKNIDNSIKEESDYLDSFIGKIGTTLTPLSPSGIISIDNKKFDVITKNSFIDKNKKVIILSVSNSRFVVKEFNDNINS